MKTYLLLWTVDPRSLPQALFHMATDRFSLRADSRITFFKSLGTGAGSTFTPRDADIRTWGLLLTFDGELEDLDSQRSIRSWRKFAHREAIYQLSPISSHGLWAKKAPFVSEDPLASRNWKGEVATITRARIRWHENLRFWRAVPEVTQSLHLADGLIRAIGIGEAPIGLQGTFSHWRSSADLRAFAYQGDAHKKAIDLTAKHRWYSEELFARFAVLQHTSVNLR